MQGFNWTSKEIKKNYVFHKLTISSDALLTSFNYALPFYTLLVLESIFSDKGYQDLALIIFVIVITLNIMKNAAMLK